MSRNTATENPLISLLSGFGELMIVNALLLVCALPVVTLGPALTAAHKTIWAMAQGRCSSIFRCYWDGFRGNLKQSMTVWLACLLPFAGGVLSWLGLGEADSRFAAAWMTGAVMLLILVLGVLVYLFPLIGRYENTLRQHIKNAAILAVCHLPRTFLLVGLSILPGVLFLWMTPWFFYLLPFWVLCGFSLLMYFCVLLIRPVFRRLDAQSSREAG